MDTQMKTKVDIVHNLYESLEKKYPMIELDKIVDNLFKSITDSLTKGDEVHIDGFGTLAITENIRKSVTKVKKVKTTKT